MDNKAASVEVSGMTLTDESREERPPAGTGGGDGGDTMTSGATGAIAYRLRVGVTGHRSLADEAALAEQVGRALQRVRQIAPSSPSTPLRLAVVSPLAEGADRLVARVVLQDPDAALEVPLPLPLHDYQTDFETEDSRREFKALLARATRVAEMPACETRAEAYEQAGRYVVDRCDVLIALWDGQPSQGQGGTAEIVEWARDRRVPLFWIHTAPPFTLTEEPGDGIVTTAFEHLDAYNRAAVQSAQFAQQMEQYTANLGTQAERTGLGRDYVQPFCAWMLPHFVRSDMLAQRYQERFFRFSDAIFLFAAFGTAVGGIASFLTGIELLSHVELLPLLEFTLMLLILLILYIGRRQGVHIRWISYRALAEQLRAALFLALALAPESPRNSAERISLKHGSDEWLQRALDELWSQRPRPQRPPPYDSLKRFLAVAWIQDQLAYQRKKSHRHERRHRWLTRATVAIFVGTLVIAGLDALGLGNHASTSLLSIALPALAGALSGIGAQREHLRNTQRSAQMARYLDSVKKRMDSAPNLAAVHAVARQAEAVMLEENNDWFLAMEFHDFELHA